MRQRADAVDRADRLADTTLAPSARTSAFTLRFASVSFAPGDTSPRSTSEANATRGASRAVMKGASVASGNGTMS